MTMSHLSAPKILHNFTHKSFINKIIIISLGFLLWQIATQWTNFKVGGVDNGQKEQFEEIFESPISHNNCSNYFDRNLLDTELLGQYKLPALKPGYIEELNCGTLWLGSGQLTVSEKLGLYNAVIEAIGKTYLQKEAGWQHYEESVLRKYLKSVEANTEVMTKSLDMFNVLSKSKFVFTIFVKPDSEIPRTNTTDMSIAAFSGNFLVNEYYPCTASGLTLEMATLPEERSCYPDLIRLKIPRKYMDTKYFTYHGWNFIPIPYVEDKMRGLRADGPKQEWSLSCPICRQIPKFLTYMLVVRNAIVVDNGFVYQIDDGLKIVPIHCSVRGGNPTPASLREIAKNPRSKVSSEDAVFVVDSVLHANDSYSILAESVLKLSLNIEYLRLNPQVSIHFGEAPSADIVRRKYLHLFGLTNRVTSGLVHTKVAFIPERIPCFKPPFLYLQSSQKRFKDVLSLDDVKQDSVLYVQRERCRPLNENNKVVDELARLAELYKLKLKIYNPDDNHSMDTTARLFHAAVLVVSVHGEELTNILFCKPGTGVVEITTYFSSANYMQMCHKLGLRYHAFYANKPGRDQCGTVEIGTDWYEFVDSIEQVLRYAFKSKQDI